jgi:hypothetical protein
MRVENPNLFVISGGPGAGKTTLLDELAGLGFRYAPEVARQIIQEQVRTGGTALPWADRAAYIDLMLQRVVRGTHTDIGAMVRRPWDTRHSRLRAPDRFGGYAGDRGRLPSLPVRFGSVSGPALA